MKTQTPTESPELSLEVAVFEDMAVRLRSYDLTTRTYANLEYERAARSSNFVRALMKRASSQALARACLRQARFLNSWEKSFCESLAHVPDLTPKQLRKLSEIAGRVGLLGLGREGR